MEWLSKRTVYKGLPNNTMNHRTSAHYTEINNIYAIEMLKKVTIFLLSTKQLLTILSEKEIHFQRLLEKPDMLDQDIIMLNHQPTLTTNDKHKHKIYTQANNIHLHLQHLSYFFNINN